MYDFEKELYADPEQDLNELWWNTVEKYQLIEKPFERNAPDWAAKIHFAIAPCYYHNYLLGELFASQLDSTFRQLEKTEDILHEEIGLFLKDKVFGPGKIHHWNEMIASATGEPLTAKYFVDQFVK
ncbi:MAG: peptidase M3A and M3B thimet/oligopeptidase F, partial [Calditrichia bacterium]|nr:peptidase M3A and M3B thimet/oligopeptidase F [Calditrichia bacterium]